MPRKPTLKICEICQSSFWDKSGHDTQRFCSKQCGSKGRNKPTSILKRMRPRETRTCPVCQKEFQFLPSASAVIKGAGTYCSRTCKGIGSRCSPVVCKVCGQSFQRTLSSKQTCSTKCAHDARKNGKTVSCACCGKEFYLPKTRLAMAQNYFCCNDHANAFQGRNKIERVCKICGKTFKWSASRLNHQNAKMLYCSTACKQADPITHEHLVRMNQIQQQGKQSSIETIGYALLDELQVTYHPQHLIGGKFCVDAFIPSANLVIQFDGDYWHGNPAKYSALDARQKKRVRLDKSQDKYMTACGYTVLRFWETEIRKNIESIKAELQAALILHTQTLVLPQ